MYTRHLYLAKGSLPIPTSLSPKQCCLFPKTRWTAGRGGVHLCGVKLRCMKKIACFNKNKTT